MKTCVLERSEVTPFFERVLKGHEVVAPVEKEKGFYVFAPVRKAEEVVLDYVTTLLPPKKAFFPQRQTLFRFRLDGDLPEMAPVIDGRPAGGLRRGAGGDPGGPGRGRAMAEGEAGEDLAGF